MSKADKQLNKIKTAIETDKIIILKIQESFLNDAAKGFFIVLNIKQLFWLRNRTLMTLIVMNT